ncbi:MAG: PLP-dependent aminotransferase family protein, partial [Planctomycetota bacterium]
MTMWTPTLQGSDPKYKQLADAIADAISDGSLEPGTRVPTHRELANRLGVTVGTVTRGYDEARRRGLLTGEVGRGTFVRGSSSPAPTFPFPRASEARIDLSLNLPPARRDTRRSTAIEAIARDGGLAGCFDYQPPEGALRHRRAGAQRISETGLETAPDDIVVTAGGQHALTVAFAGAARPGATVLCEELTYPGFLVLARLFAWNVVEVKMDAQGLCPTALDAACRKHSPAAIYCAPTLQNPTARTQPISRRKQVAAVLDQYRVALVEDDTYGYLLKKPLPPLATYMSRGAFYLHSLSKCVAPGLRIAYLRVPPELREATVAAVTATTLMASPILAEIASTWIEDGTAAEFEAETRDEMTKRRRIARKVLGDAADVQRDSGLHLWYELPEPWRASDFVDEALARGVAVTSPDSFLAGRAAAPHPVRVCLGPAASLHQRERGLGILAA